MPVKILRWMAMNPLVLKSSDCVERIFAMLAETLSASCIPLSSVSLSALVR